MLTHVHLKLQVGDRLFMLDEFGETILGKWNFAEDKMDPYIPGEELEAYAEEEKMKREGYYYDFSKVGKEGEDDEEEEEEATDGEDNKTATETDGSADVAEKDE